MYAMDHYDRFPEKKGQAGLQQLVTGIYIKPEALHCPGHKDKTTPSYVYFNGYMVGSSDEFGVADSPVAFDMPGNHPGIINVAFQDGRLEGFYTNAQNATQLIDFLKRKFKYTDNHLKLLYKKAAEEDKRIQTYNK